jgi:Fe-S oxidoreductase
MSLEAYKELIHRCFRCGHCKYPSEESTDFNCPPYKRFGFETYSPGGMLWLIRGLLEGSLEGTKDLAKIFYSCTGCRSCLDNCRLYSWRASRGKAFPEAWKIVRAVKEEFLEKFLAPPKVAEFLENVYRLGNPYGEARWKREEWAKGRGIKRYEPGDEFLYYVGCVGSYDTKGQVAASSLAEVLRYSGVSFGILGEEENCDGNEVNMLGERGLFEMLAKQNLQKFRDLGIKKIVTLSPHSYHSFKNDYPTLGGDFEVFHYTQLLRDLIREGKLKFSKDFPARVTYHDPCFLGRHNEEYEAPREILSSIPKLEFKEMGRNKSNSFCCGGGGGNFITDFLGGSEDSPARVRIREARDTGARVLAVACPICLSQLEDARKVEGLEEELVVKDISQIVREACGLKSQHPFTAPE